VTHLLSSKGKFLLSVLVFAAGLVIQLRAADLRGTKLNFASFKEFNADSWQFVGQNIIAKKVYIPAGDLEIYADQAVINIESRDFEASGNVRVHRWQSTGGTVDMAKLARLQDAPNLNLTVLGITGDIWGEQMAKVSVSMLTDNIKAKKMSGNLDSGYFRFDDVQLQFQTFVCKAKSAERQPDGIINVTDAEISSCNYLEDDNAHYSIGCSSAQLTPHTTEFYGLETIDTDVGDYSVFLTNGFWKVYGVPILWLPAFYKPKDESPGLFSAQWGHASDWGYYVMLSKRFTFSEYPYASVKVMGDYYSQRGFGYGAKGEFNTDNSRTEFFAYGIWDMDQYKTDHYNRYRIDIPKTRYDFRISNVTHITPRLDFRGALEFISDPYFTRDFFSERYDRDPQPATYMSLEQQFDHFSASLYIRPKINSFYTTVQRLPGFRLDVPRQQIFDTNFYYQGDLSLDYLKMDWIKFDEKNKLYPNERLQNYSSFRMDTTHFLYFPIRFDWLTLIPRAGLKLTAYSNTSKKKVGTEALMEQFMAADPQNRTGFPLTNYDNKGGAKLRFLGEIGVEASTKIYNSWQNVRSSFLALDGLRHVIRPYINYTLIPRPNVSRDHLYYFDDIDRIDKQHFIRFGLENRLQTRDGNSVRDYFSMENYWDLHMQKEDDFSQIGDFCTILTATPFKGFSISTLFSIDAGGNNGEVPETIRSGREAGHPGLNLRWLNRWNIVLRYTPAPDWDFMFAYIYHRPYSSRSAYSMGSTLTQLDAGSFFNKYFDEHTEELRFSVRLPITPDRRTFAAYAMSYDIQEGYIDVHTVQIIRNFHCWEIAAGMQWERDDDDNNYKQSFLFSVYLTGLQSPLFGGSQNQILSQADSEMRMPGSSRGSKLWGND
jgi:hypothetical protein